MDRKQIDLKRAEEEQAKIEELRAELDGREPEGKAFTKPFVAHGGKSPSPPSPPSPPASL